MVLCLSGVYTPNGVYTKLSCANKNPQYRKSRYKYS